MSVFYNRVRTLFALLPSLFFCFYHLPFKQAIRLPIIVYKPSMSFLFSKGKFIIDAIPIHFGMIRLGIFITPQYPNSGIEGVNKFPSYSLFAGVPAILKKTGVWRDATDDVINYTES